MKLFKSISPKNFHNPFIFNETSHRVYSFEGFIIYGLDHYHECADIINSQVFLSWLEALKLKSECDVLIQIQTKDASNLQKLILFFETVDFIDENSMRKLKDDLKLWDKLPAHLQLKKRGDLFFHEKRYDLALKLYKRAQQEEFDSIVEHNIAVTFMKLNFFNEAEIAFKHALMYNDAIEMHLNLIKLFKIVGRYDEALEYAIKLSEKFNNWEILYEIGCVYESLEQYQNALKVYLNAADLNNNEQVIFNIITVILKLKEQHIYDNSISLSLYLEALKDKNMVYYYVLKAKILEIDDCTEKAIEVLEEGLTVLKGNKSIAIELAKLCRNKKRIIQSIQAISKAYNEEEMDEDILFEMALIAKRAGNRQDYTNKLIELINYWKTLIRGSFND